MQVLKFNSDCLLCAGLARVTERSDGGSRPPIFGIDVPVASPNKDPVGWTCPTCTFVNKPARPGCEMCSASRPADYQPPLDYEYDDSEKELIKKLDEDEDTMRRVRDQAGVLLPVCACTCMLPSYLVIFHYASTLSYSGMQAPCL